MGMHHLLRRVVLGLCVMATAQMVVAQDKSGAPDVHIVWMGGNDCPPCLAWRATELPKLKQSPEFKTVQFSYVNKSITSAVPMALFLPEEVRPYKKKLDIASAGMSGSPQAAVLVNGEVFDYFQGTRSAQDIERMLIAVRTGGEYPFKRCIRMSKTTRHQCEVPG